MCKLLGVICRHAVLQDTAQTLRYSFLWSLVSLSHVLTNPQQKLRPDAKMNVPIRLQCIQLSSDSTSILTHH